MKKMAAIGPGYVSLPLAIAFGEMREVVESDINAKRIGEPKRGEDLTQLVKARTATRTKGGFLTLMPGLFRDYCTGVDPYDQKDRGVRHGPTGLLPLGEAVLRR